MTPPVSKQSQLISYFGDFGNPIPLGHIDPRFGLAQAAGKRGTPKTKKY